MTPRIHHWIEAEPGWRLPVYEVGGRLLYPLAGATTRNATYAQSSYRFRDDDGSQAAATWKAAADTNISQAKDTGFRLRVLIQQTLSNANANLSHAFKLQFSRNGGAYTDVGAQGAAVAVRYVNSTHLTDGGATTQQLGAGSFIAGTVEETTPTGTVVFSGASETEFEFALELNGAIVAVGDTLDFRVAFNGSSPTAMTYTVTGRATVAAPNTNVAGAQPAATGSIAAEITPSQARPLASGFQANAVSGTTASFTPTAGRVVLVCLHQQFVGTVPEPTVSFSGDGLPTFTVVRTFTGSNRRHTIWRALVGASPTAGTITFTTAVSHDEFGWSVVEFDGLDAGGTNAANAIVQSAEDFQNVNVTSLTVTLAAFGSSNNRPFGFLAAFSNDDPTPEAGYVQLHEVRNTTWGNSINTMWKPDGADTTVNWTIGNHNAWGFAVELKATAGVSVEVAGAQPAPTGSIAAQQTLLRSLSGAQPSATATTAAQQALVRSIAGSQPSATGAVAALQTLSISLSGSQPSGAGVLAVAYRIALGGSQPTATGSIASEAIFAATVEGAQPAATGALTALQTLLRSLTGAQPAPTGTLAALQSLLVTLAGAHPAATGTIATEGATFVDVAGVQPAASGSLAAAQSLQRSVAGAQPAASGTTAVRYIIALAGSQPTGTGTIDAAEGAEEIALAGVQPAPSGSLAALQVLAVVVTGVQPAGSGALAAQQMLAIVVVGAQPSATGSLGALQTLAVLLSGAQPAAAGVLGVPTEVAIVIGGSLDVPSKVAGALDVRPLVGATLDVQSISRDELEGF